jgi:hypothetical protein
MDLVSVRRLFSAQSIEVCACLSYALHVENALHQNVNIYIKFLFSHFEFYFILSKTFAYY